MPDESETLLDVAGLRVVFGLRGGRSAKRTFAAVDGVDLTIRPGETLGVAGESGSGKTTLGMAIVGHRTPTEGRITFEGADVTNARGKAQRSMRGRIQMIFQDPNTSLNPRMRVWQIVTEPLVVHRAERDRAALRARAEELVTQCGLPPDAVDRYPLAFSGGQRQRIGIARALALSPSLIIADEPTSALDVSVQAQIINLMRELQATHRVAYLFISHNLAVLRQMSDRIAIMYRGRIVESGPADEVLSNPAHDYTQKLLSAVPVSGFDADGQAELPMERIT